MFNEFLETLNKILGLLQLILSDYIKGLITLFSKITFAIEFTVLSAIIS